MLYSTITPINNRHLVELEDRNENRLIHLGGGRSIESARYGMCLRSAEYTGCRLLVAHGGTPISNNGSLVMVQGSAIIRVDGVLREPYAHISPVEFIQSKLIITPEIYNFSGWYRVLDIFPNPEVQVEDIILPIYGTPRLEMSDNTEYISINGIGVKQC
jgi:hypothetical protein